jgi:hypothetical protein
MEGRGSGQAPRGLELAVDPLPATAMFADLLWRLNDFAFAVALVAL